jgi:glutamate racemase
MERLECMHVAFFDSGLGGLSIAKAAIALNADYLTTVSYIADTGAFPYGDKDDAWLADRIEAVIAKSISLLAPDMVVVACNTASTLTLDRLRQRFSVPFIGVVPAIKPAAQITKRTCIGVLATPATVARDYTAQLIRDHAPDKTVVLLGCPELVLAAEHKLLGEPFSQEAITACLQRLYTDCQETPPDTVVLACTHFPLIIDELNRANALLKRDPLRWVDSGDGIARRLASLLQAYPQPAGDAPLTMHWVSTPGQFQADHYRPEQVCEWMNSLVVNSRWAPLPRSLRLHQLAIGTPSIP